MINHISILRDLTLIVTMASIFTVLVLMILKVLRPAAFFEGARAVAMTVSLSLLFLIALFQFLLFPNTGSGNSVNAAVDHFYPLPWVALSVAAAVVLSQVLLLASRIPPSEKLSTGDGETVAKESENSLAKPRSRGRPKKKEDKPAETKPKETTEPVGSTS
jgi:hypothetical protein